MVTVTNLTFVNVKMATQEIQTTLVYLYVKLHASMVTVWNLTLVSVTKASIFLKANAFQKLPLLSVTNQFARKIAQEAYAKLIQVTGTFFCFLIFVYIISFPEHRSPRL
jgi:hypothetical protein